MVVLEKTFLIMFVRILNLLVRIFLINISRDVVTDNVACV